MEAQALYTMNKIAAALLKTPGKPSDLDGTLKHIAHTAHDAFGADACVIVGFNPITSKFIGSQTVGAQVQAKNGLPLKKPGLKGMTQQVLRDGMLLVEDVERQPQYHNRFTRKAGVGAFAGVAMRTRHRQRPLGVIYLDFKQPRTFSPADRESFQNFAVQASFLLQETWLAGHYEQVARIGQEVNYNLATIDDLFQVLQTYVDAVLDESHTLVLAVCQPQTSTLDIHLREHGETILLSTLLHSVYQHIIETQQPLFIQQLSKKAAHLPFQVINITGTEQKESLIFIPLLLRGVSLGVLSIQHASPNAYGQEDLFTLQLLASYTALGLHNIRLYSGLSQLNDTGQLLTQQLESEHTLQVIVGQIQEATKADLVVLYPYEPTLQCFDFPARIAGTLLDSTIQSMYPNRPDAIASLMLHRERPIFAKDSTLLYTELQGNDLIRQGTFPQREKIRSAAAMPLRVGDESVGVLFVNFRQPQRFDATQKLFIEGLAHYAAIAMKNAQEYGSLIQRRVRELEILQYIDRELNRTLDLESILNTLLRLAREQVHAEEAAISLYDPRTQVLELATVLGRHAEVRRKLNIPLQEIKGIARWVLEHKKPVRVDNVHRDLPWRELYFQTVDDTLSELDVPLLDGEEVVGVLNFESTSEGVFGQEDEDFLVTLAGQAVLAIKNAQAYGREKRLAEERQVLNEISKQITSQLDLSHVFDLILEKALELTHSTRGNLMLYDHDQNDLWMAAERGVAEDKKGQHQSLDEGIVGFVARNKQLLNVDPSRPPWNQIYLGFIPGTRSELTVPMFAGNDLRGVLNIESPSLKNFTERDERLLQGLADLAVIALQNAQAYEREKRFLEEAQALNEISKQITSQLDPVLVFDLILEKALELTYSHMGNLMLYDRDQNDLWMAAERGVAEDKKGKRQRLGQGIVGYVAETKQLLNVQDVSQHPWSEIFLKYILGTRSELAVPLLTGNELHGVLNVESPTPHNFGERDERVLKALADLAVVALQNAELYNKAEREAQRFELLYEAGQELSKITDLEQLERAYEVVVHIGERQSQSQAVIYRYDEMNAEVVLKCASPYRQALFFGRIKLDEGLSGQVARERRTIVLHDTDNLSTDVVVVNQSDPRMHSLVVTPIMFKDCYYGNLVLSHEEAGYFRGKDIQFFEGLAQQLAITIHRLETVQARQEFEQRARSAEIMSSIGQSAFEVTHRLGNDLGVVGPYITNIQLELEKLDVTNMFISQNLGDILQSVQAVLSFSGDLKQELVQLDAKEKTAGEPVIISPRELLEEAQQAFLALPSNTQICLEVEEDVAAVRIIHSLVADILRNLVANAIEAMPAGGKIILRGRNAIRSVALEVIDTGVGIPLENLSKIFNLSFSTKGSSGFGLWSAWRNACKCAGDLKVESQLGQGTTFKLLLPRVDS